MNPGTANGVHVACLAASLLVCSAAAGTTYYVNGTCGNDANNGFGPDCGDPTDKPKATIQAAINLATTDGDVVIVADGTYTGTGNIDLTIHNVSITVQSENGAASCTIDCDDSGRGFELTASGDDNASEIDGFTIENGNVTGLGGAILCDSDTEIEIRNCVLTDSSASTSGGAIAFSSSGTVYECVISGNTAGSRGGGVFCTGSDTHLEVRNCTVEGNVAVDDGGGICATGNSSIDVIRCKVRDNEVTSSGEYGGGIGIVTQSRVRPCSIVNCVVQGNENPGEGGGIGVEGPEVLTGEELFITNCLIIENDGSIGGGIYEYYLDVIEVTNCTISGNTASDGGAIFFEENDFECRLFNSVLWDDEATGDGAEIYVMQNDGEDFSLVIDYCAVEGDEAGIEGDTNDVDWGDHNVEELDDPGFVDPGADDYHLCSGSALIDVGSDADVPLDLHDVDEDGFDDEEETPDLDLNARINDGDGAGGADVDLGAYEFYDELYCPADIDDSGGVDFADLLLILDNWNCTTCDDEDLNDDDVVDFGDLLIVLDEWGDCCVPGNAPSFAEDLECRDIDYDTCWKGDNQIEEMLEFGSVQDQADAICWIEHYDTCHCPDTCVSAPTTCGDDPCGLH